MLPRVHVSRLEVATLAGLGALVAWTALSVIWSLDPAQSMLDAQRGLAYLAGLAALLLFMRPSSVGAVLAALVVACTLASAYALAMWLLSDATEDAGALSAPIGYSSALGLLAAMGSLLALGFAARAKAALTRAVAAAALVPLASTLALAASRSAFAGLAIGLAVAVALGPGRRDVVVATLALLPTPAVAAAVSATEAAVSGRTLAIVLLFLTGGSAALSLAVGMARDRLRARLVTGAIAVLLLLAGAATTLSDRRSDPRPLGAPAAGAFDVGRTGHSLRMRLRLWEVAWRSARKQPLRGAGAGSYGRSWAEHRRTRNNARDAHNLYLETLGELGAVGLGLLLLALAAPLLAGVRARRHPLVPAAAGAYTAYLAHAGAHWDWEVPALTLTALSCGAAMLVTDRRAPDGRGLRGPTRAVAFAAVLAMSLLAFAGLVGNAALTRSRAAAATGAPNEAAAQARTATRWQPWSGEPWRLLGEAALAEGDVSLARASFRRGLERDPRSWRLWTDLSLVSGGRVKRMTVRRAARLNPLGRR